MRTKDRTCEPAYGILTRIGMSHGEIARELQIAVSTVGRWPLSHEEGGRGGIIPFKYWKAIRRLARKRGITLLATDFIPVEHRSVGR